MEELLVLMHVAVCTEGDKILKRVISLLTPLDLVMDLQILEGPALLTPPPVPLQHPRHQAAVGLFPQLDPLRLPQHLRAASGSASSAWFAKRAW
jgi:hypothetical protein